MWHSGPRLCYGGMGTVTRNMLANNALHGRWLVVCFFATVTVLGLRPDGVEFSAREK